MKYQEETKNGMKQGRFFCSLRKMLLRTSVLALIIMILVPLSGYSAKAESSDFLIYVDQVLTVSGHGTVVVGKVASGQVYKNDTLWHAYSKSDGSGEYRVVKASELIRFRKYWEYAETGDDVEICLGDYDASLIHVGDVLISDSYSPFKLYRGPIYGTYKNDKYNYKSFSPNTPVILKKGELEISASSVGYGFLSYGDEFEMSFSNQDRSHVYTIGEQFEVIRDGGRVGTYTVSEITDTPAKAIVEKRYDLEGAAPILPDEFITSESYPWQVGTDDDYVFARSGNSNKPDSTSTLSYSYTSSVPTTVRFTLKRHFDSHDGGDKYIFFIDGHIEDESVETENIWKTFYYALPAGSHELKWEYVKDNDEYTDEDYIGIEGFTIYPGRKRILDANGGIFESTNTATQDVYALRGYALSIFQDSEYEQPTRRGYKFLGYSTKANPGKGELVSYLNWYAEEYDKTLYAIWDREEYNVFRDLPFAMPGEQDEWTCVDADGDYDNWMSGFGSSYGFITMVSMFYDEDETFEPEDPTADNRLISPAIKLGNLRYSLRFRAQNDEPFSVYIGTENDIAKMKKTAEISTGVDRECTISLEGYENKTIYIAFRHQVKSNGHGVFLSHVRVVSEFADVRSASNNGKDPYYYDPVYWAQKEGITGGVKDKDGVARNFNPQGVCNRAQMVSFLWRMAGCPEPTKYTSYKDVKKTDYFYKAVSWAQEKGITGGYTDGTFRPTNPCSRGQAVTFLYRMAGQPKVTGSSSFSDVKTGTYYHNAVIWASEKGITGGYSDGTFKPDGQCTRAQMVTFLYRYDLTK